MQLVGTSATLEQTKLALYPSISICPVRQWMDPFFATGRTDAIGFNGDPDLNEMLSRLVFTYYQNDTNRYLVNMN